MNVNRPIGINTYVAPQGPVGGNAPQPVTVAVNTYQAQPGQMQVAGAGNGVLSMLGNLLSGLVNFVKNAFSKIFGAGAPAQPGQAAPAPAPGTTTAGPDDATVAAQFGLLNTPQNVAAFKATLAAQQAEPDVLGPGMNNPEAAAELQQLLAQWGYPVQATGQYDAATADAVMQFKTANGLTENFAFANGQPGVTPFIDNRTRAKMLELLTSGQAPAPGTATAPTPAPAQPTGDAAAIAAQFHLAPDAANVAAYQAAAAEALGKGAIGPGNAPADAISELQTLLAQWGYPMAVTGQFDQATIDGLLTFKAHNNLTDARFKMSDGSTGITPFVDEATQAVMLKKLEGTAAAPAPAPAPAPTPAAPATQYQAAGLSAEEARIAAEQGILATRENFDAFVKEAQALEAQNAVGPGTTQTDAVNELQQILAQWGYAVAATGQFDQATADAVIKFKRDNGVASSYKLADGTPGVHPFVDDATKAVMMKKLGLA